MNLRAQLTFLFITIVAVIIILASTAIYYFSADYREDDFYNRLLNKSISTAKLLIEVEEVDATLLRRLETDNPTSLPDEKIIIYDYQNEILFSTDEEHVIKIDSTLLNRIRLEEQVRFKEGPYEILGFLFADQYDRFVVIAGATDIYGLKKLQNLRVILFAVFFVSIILVSISGWIYAGRSLKPISRVIDNVKEISITSLNLRVDEGNGKDELAQLAHTFNEMLDRLERAFKIQKNFIANASHELRTPLTAITGQLEVLLMKKRSVEEYEKSLQSILDDIRSLNSISNRLLLLAQTSSENSKENFKDVRMDEVLWQAREELTKRHSDYGITITLDQELDDANDMTIHGDEQLLKTLVLNLMDNGCKYSNPHQVQVRMGAAEGILHLTFEDKGLGIAEEDLKQIFQPFQRGKNTSHIKGHGIGLSLVEAILRLHAGTVHVSSHPGQGTTFHLEIPTATA